MKLQGTIVVSGIGCRLPESENLEEFREHLFNGDDMVTEDDRRWPPGIFGVPRRNGKLKDVASFDAGAFMIHPKQADNLDPQMRILHEVCYEAILDAGEFLSEMLKKIKNFSSFHSIEYLN